MNRDEHTFQIAVMRYLRLALPAGAYVTSIDHAARLSRYQATMRKARGVKRGIPDILVVHAGVTLWLELKAERGSLSEDQRDTHDALRSNQHCVAVCKTLDQVQIALVAAGIPARASTDAAPVRRPRYSRFNEPVPL